MTNEPRGRLSWLQDQDYCGIIWGKPYLLACFPIFVESERLARSMNRVIEKAGDIQWAFPELRTDLRRHDGTPKTTYELERDINRKDDTWTAKTNSPPS